jgi:hypothetical protein
MKDRAKIVVRSFVKPFFPFELTLTSLHIFVEQILPAKLAVIPEVIDSLPLFKMHNIQVFKNPFTISPMEA